MCRMKKVYINPFAQQSEIYAKRIDEALASKNMVLLQDLLSEAEKILPAVNDASKAQLYYSMGNIYDGLAKERLISFEESLKKQLFYFRKSIILIEANKEYLKDKYEPYIKAFKCSLYTNYGNTLSCCGRKIEAISQYKKVIDIYPCFGMAVGNLGYLYQLYGEMDYDNGHQNYFHYFAYSLLKIAIECKDPNTYEDAKKYFSKVISVYSPQYVNEFLQKKLDIPKFFYDNKDELLYRTWAVKNNLFLNTLNDLPVAELCFASDVLQLPDMIFSINDKPIFHGMFNQIKQEYVYARYQYYLSLHQRDEVHYSDKDTYLVNFIDYPKYGIRIEQLKTAYKVLYGIFDKVAYFLNFYFKLGMSDRAVSFKNIWSTDFNKEKNKHRKTLNHKENFALASMYWISRDFYDTFEDSPNPKLKRISDIRNALEHKYVKVIDDWIPERANGEIDDLALYVTETELSSLTIELMHIVREAIICLSLCVNIEEMKKNKDILIMPIPLTTYDDEWKV